MLDSAPRSEFDIVPWSSSFEIGVAIIDEQHRQLVALLNELGQGYVCGAEDSEVKRILVALIDTLTITLPQKKHCGLSCR